MSYTLSMLIMLSVGFGTIVCKIWFAERKVRKQNREFTTGNDRIRVPDTKHLTELV